MLRRPMAVVGLCGAAVAAVGVIVLAAWLTGSIGLIRMRPDLFPMPFNAALTLAATGIAITLLSVGRERPAAGVGLTIALLAGLSLVENVTGTSLGIDELFWTDNLTDLADLRGRLPTLPSLAFAATGLLLATTPLRWEVTLRSAAESTLGALLFGAGIIAFVAQMAGMNAAFAESLFTRMSVHGAFSMALVGVALIALPWARWEAQAPARRSSEGSVATNGEVDGELHPILGWWLPLPAAAGTFAAVLMLWSAAIATLRQTGGPTGERMADTAIVIVAVVVAAVVVVAARLWAAAVAARRRLAAEVARRSLAEEALRRNADQLASITNYSPDIIARFDRDLRCLYVNPAGEVLLGALADVIASRPLTESAIPRQLAEAIEAQMRSVIDAGSPVTTEYEFTDSQGQVRVYEVLLSAERGPGGDTVSVVAVGREITARRTAERALQKSEAEYRTIFEQSLHAIDVFDADGRFVRVNSALCQLLEYTEEELTRLRVADVTHSGDVAATDEQLAKLRRREHEHYVREKRYTTKSGRVIEAVVYVSGMYDERNEYLGATATIMDVTERRAAERALRESEERFRQLAANVPVGVFRTDASGRPVYVNEHWSVISGMPGGDATGDGWIAAVHPADRDHVVARWSEAVARGEPYAGEFRFARPDGSEAWVYSLATPVRSSDGQVVGYIGSATDITERRRAEEERLHLEAQVQHSQKLESLGLLAGGIAHDFNNMLVAILGNAGLALRQLPPGSPARQELRDIEAAAQRAAELARQMLAYSGKGQFIVEPLDVTRLVDEMSHLLEASVSKRAVVRREFARDLPPIVADATQIRQVVMNLMTNASDALGDAGGIISIRTGSMTVDRGYLEHVHLGESIDEGSYVFVEVSDTGGGMDVETRERIFDPFFTTKHTGRGLGLAAVLGIVRGHRGAIKVYSEPGSGSTFKVLFPAAPEQTAIGDGPIAGPGKSARRVGGTILVIDDEASIRLVARRILENSGYAVIDAADGRAGIAAFREHADDVAAVLLDLTMPDLDGEETYRQLRGIRPEVRVVLTSGFNEQATLGRFGGRDLAGFLQKPYRLDELVSVMAAAVDGAAPGRKGGVPGR